MNSDQKAYCIVAGKLITHLRTSSGYSQGSLARQVGIAQSTLSRIERGEIAADSWQLKQLAKAFDMTPMKLTERIEESFDRTQRAAAQSLGDNENWDGVFTAVGVIGIASLAGFVVAALLRAFDES